jgi:hypothetical protein
MSGDASKNVTDSSRPGISLFSSRQTLPYDFADPVAVDRYSQVISIH